MLNYVCTILIIIDNLKSIEQFKIEVQYSVEFGKLISKHCFVKEEVLYNRPYRINLKKILYVAQGR